MHQDLPERSSDAYANLANSQSSGYQRQGPSTASAKLHGEPGTVKKINTKNPFTATSEICNLQVRGWEGGQEGTEPGCRTDKE